MTLIERRASSRPLRWLLGSTAAAVTAQGIVAAAAPLLAASLTRDPVAVSLVAASAWLPWLLIGLPAGALVERWVKRRVMVSTDAVRGLVLLVLTVVILWGHAAIWSLALAVFLVGVGSCFFDPAAQSEIPELVGRDPKAVADANASYWTLDALARTLVGSSAGAIAFGLAQWAPFAASAFLLVVSAALLTRLPSRPVPARAPGSRDLRAELAGGLRELWSSTPLRRNALLMATYNVWWNIVFATLILLLLHRFQISSWMWGALVSSMAVGGVAGGAWAKRNHTVSVERAYGLGFLVQAAGWLAVLVAPMWWLAFPGMVAVGVASTAVSAIGGAGIQLATPEGMLARVTSGIRLLGIGAAAVGAGLSGPIAAIAGLSAPTITAAAALVVASVWALRQG
ncbi:MFS transporter [Kineosporia sp. A_224]|uniref:MFS transporter n=1 Tax=Kineosporia sp. A_224 TaxID=1962180 RepID=UPI000B4ACF08|nr:MFS transporter [Kineosporia sp. A_224]